MKHLEIYIAIAMVVLLVTLPKGHGQVMQEPFYEDQVIVCVPDLVTEMKADINCHKYDTDDLDWYQSANDGSFFKHDDSFEMWYVD